MYVTTADVAVSGLVLHNSTRILTLSLLMAVAVLALRFVGQQCDPSRSPTLGDLATATFVGAAVLMLAVIGWHGDGLFNLSRDSVRAWIVSTIFASLCLALTVAGTDGSRLRVAIGVSAMCFSVFVVSAFPSNDFVFRGGVASLRMQIALAASSFPFLLGAGLTFSGLAHHFSAATRHMAGAGLAIIVTAVGIRLVRHIVAFRDESFPETAYVPQLSAWFVSIPVAALAFGWFSWRQRARSFRMNLGAVFSGAVSLIVTAVVALEFLATRSPYLAYQIGTPTLEPYPSVATLPVAGALLLMPSILWGLKRPGGNPAVSSARWVSAALAPTALVLGAVFFTGVNYGHSHRGMFRAIMSLDRDSGDVQWILHGLEGPQPQADGRNSPATPTPVTNGTLVCAYFGTPGLMCGDSNGRIAWSRKDLAYEGFYGVGFSPLLIDDMLLIAIDRPDGLALVHALDATTGASLWTHRFATTPTLTGNSRTPLVRGMDGEKVLILWGMEYVKALLIRSGEPMWEYRYTSGGDLVSSATSDAERLYLSDRSGTVALDYASLAAGRDPVRWSNKARANCVSPILVKGMLFTVSDAGIAAAIRADTGETLWRRRLPGHYFASLVASPEAVYFTNSDGLTTVIATDGSFQIIAQNDIGEETFASMAAADGQLFIRTTRHAFAVAAQ